MEKSIVALVRCDEYSELRVDKAVIKGIDLLGGISRYVKPGEKIVLKPNVLIGSDPARSVTTHPSVFKAVGKLLQEAGAVVSYGDSSAFGGSEFNLKRAKLKEAGDELGFRLADFDHGEEVSHKKALLSKKLVIAEGVLSADGLVSLPKLKTHGLTRFTGAVKNQFGCIPGLHKREFHFKMPDPRDFATMLVDINTFIQPRLYVMDGIIAMEGNGPFSGKPRRMNVVLFSTDPVALDSIACKMINLNPEFVPTAQPGEKAGLGNYHYENITIVGDDLNPLIVNSFKVTRRPPVLISEGPLKAFIRNQLTPRPVINRAKCNRCGTCMSACPAGTEALNWINRDEPPAYQYSKCIRCYCCQETCPEGAITVVNPLLGKLFIR